MAQKQATNGGEQPVFNTELVLGGMRDHVLRVVKQHLNWSKMPEKKQVSIANEVEQACRQAIRGATPIIAARGFGTIVTTVGDINTKGELVIAKLSAERTRDNIVALAEAGRCILVQADAEQFMGARPAEIMKDQPDLMDKAPETAAQREERERTESEARAEQFKQAPVETLDDVMTKTAEGTAPEPSEGEPVKMGDGTVIDNATGEVIHPGETIPPRLPRGHRGRKALPAPAPADA